MKNTLIVATLFLFLVSCSSLSSTDAMKDFIPGTYVCPFTDSIYETTFTKGVDTLHIARQTASGSETYQIDRSKKFIRTVEGKVLPEEYKRETWTGSYQPTDKTLFITNTGGTIAFDVENRLAKIGKIEYKKIE